MVAARFYAFVSYSHRDMVWGDWLHKTLESYAVPKRLVGQLTDAGIIPRRLAPIFRDRDELASATDLNRQVNSALAQSDNLIVICSPDSAASRWVNEEVLAFKRLGRAERIFCLIVAGEPNASDKPGHGDKECFVPALRFELGADGQLGNRRSEPVAADARRGKDGKANAKLMLVAGLLGVGLDALKQRELQRRHRRMVAVLALALLVASVTSVLGVVAVVAQHAAERRQKQAEALVDYMLGDLDDRLREVSRLDILEGVADKAMQYFQSLPASDVTDGTLAERAKALQKIGSIRIDQGHPEAALASYQAALELTGRLVRRNPRNATWQLGHAQTIAYIGMVRWQQGMTAEAGRDFAQAHAILERALADAPQSIPLLAEISNQSTNNGRLLESSGQLDAAREQYLQVLRINERLLRLQPGESRWQSELGYANNNLGKLAAGRGQLMEAARYFQTDLDIKRKLSRSDPSNNQAHGDLALAHMFMAKIRNQTGDTAQARQDAQAALALLTDLARFDPAQTWWRYLLALDEKYLAVISLDLDQVPEAASHNRSSQALFDQLLASDQKNLRWRLRQLEGQVLASEISLRQGNRALARKLAEEAIDHLSAIEVGDADRQELARLQALSLIQVAQAIGTGSSVDADRYWRQAESRLSPLVAGSKDPELLDPWLRIALALKTQPFPEQAMQTLRNAGYAKPGFLAALHGARIPYPLPQAATAKR